MSLISICLHFTDSIGPGVQGSSESYDLTRRWPACPPNAQAERPAQPVRCLLFGGPADLEGDAWQPRSLLGARQMGFDRKRQPACRHIGPERVTHLADQ